MLEAEEDCLAGSCRRIAPEETPSARGRDNRNFQSGKEQNASGNEKEKIPNNWGPQKMSVQHHGNNGAGGVAEEIFETRMTETFPKLMSDHQSKRLRKH